MSDTPTRLDSHQIEDIIYKKHDGIAPQVNGRVLLHVIVRDVLDVLVEEGFIKLEVCDV